MSLELPTMRQGRASSLRPGDAENARDQLNHGGELERLAHEGGVACPAGTDGSLTLRWRELDSNLYGAFSCQVVVFDLLPVLCSEVCPGKACMFSRGIVLPV